MLSSGEKYFCIYRIEIYPVDGVIQPYNCQGPGFFIWGGGGRCWWVGGGKLHVKVFMYIVSRDTSKLFNTS